ncbi:hypothetical protein D9M72_580990 [compost metagenome]
MKVKLVARNHRTAELGFVDRHEINKAGRICSLLEHSNCTGCLCHGFNDKNARHDRFVRKMAGKMRLIDRDILDACR